MEYFYDEADKNHCPFIIRKLTPIQMPSIDIDEVKAARANFSDEEWIDLVLRSTGMEPSQFDKRVKWLHLARLIPKTTITYANLVLEVPVNPISTRKSAQIAF